MIPLHSKLDNGASVADWLGTAGSAAIAASSYLDLVRQGRSTNDPLILLDSAERRLEEALEELRTVRRHIAHVAAYGERPSS